MRYKKLLIVTGKGLRSKVKENPYISKEMSVLRYSVPDFIFLIQKLLKKKIKVREIKKKLQ